MITFTFTLSFHLLLRNLFTIYFSVTFPLHSFHTVIFWLTFISSLYFSYSSSLQHSFSNSSSVHHFSSLCVSHSQFGSVSPLRLAHFTHLSSDSSSRHVSFCCVIHSHFTLVSPLSLTKFALHILFHFHTHFLLSTVVQSHLSVFLIFTVPTVFLIFFLRVCCCCVIQSSFLSSPRITPHSLTNSLSHFHCFLFLIHKCNFIYLQWLILFILVSPFILRCTSLSHLFSLSSRRISSFSHCCFVVYILVFVHASLGFSSLFTHSLLSFSSWFALCLRWCGGVVLWGFGRPFGPDPVSLNSSSVPPFLLVPSCVLSLFSIIFSFVLLGLPGLRRSFIIPHSGSLSSVWLEGAPSFIASLALNLSHLPHILIHSVSVSFSIHSLSPPLYYYHFIMHTTVLLSCIFPWYINVSCNVIPFHTVSWQPSATSVCINVSLCVTLHQFCSRVCHISSFYLKIRHLASYHPWICHIKHNYIQHYTTLLHTSLHYHKKSCCHNVPHSHNTFPQTVSYRPCI